VLRPVLPTRSPLPRPDTRPLRAAADSCPGWRLRAPDSCCAGTGRHRRSLIAISDPLRRSSFLAVVMPVSPGRRRER
jgi:hypothetical protein